jgi:hypothetical protein
MFGNDVNKKAGKPVRGYRWMAFTFTMIFILCLIVLFHEDFEKLKKKSIETIKTNANGVVGAITGNVEDEVPATTPVVPPATTPVVPPVVAPTVPADQPEPTDPVESIPESTEEPADPVEPAAPVV